LIYAGRVGTGMPVAELERVLRRLRPLAIDGVPLSAPPPRNSRFGSPLVLSRIHRVRPKMVVEVSYAEWTPDGLFRHPVYLGERQDKLASDVRRDHLGALFGGVYEVASNPTKPAPAEDIVQTQSHIRELTKVCERKVRGVPVRHSRRGQDERRRR
jgi:hypothetical protein